MAARFVLPLVRNAVLQGRAATTLPEASYGFAQRSLELCRSLSTSRPALHSTEGPDPPSTSPLKDRGPFTSRLAHRSIIHIDGPDCISFLQGLVSNDVSHFDSDKPPTSSLPTPNPNQPAAQRPPVYAALLTPQGRFLFDMFLYKPVEDREKLNREGTGPGEGGPGGLFADVDAETKDELLQTLQRYKLRANVGIHDVSKDFAAWARFGGALSEKPEEGVEAEAGAIGYGGTTDRAGMAAAEAEEEGWRWTKDPRLAELGLRGIFSSTGTPPLVESDETLDDRYYRIWRYEHGVPEGPFEIPKGEAIPLEYNLDGLHGVSYEKGCYVGQELIARTHHKGVVRKRVFPVVFGEGTKEVDDEYIPPGSEIVDKQSGKKVGKVTAALGSRGLALLRLEVALKEGGS